MRVERTYRHVGSNDLIFDEFEIEREPRRITAIQYNDDGDPISKPVQFKAALSESKERFLLAIGAIEVVAERKPIPPAPAEKEAK